MSSSPSLSKQNGPPIKYGKVLYIQKEQRGPPVVHSLFLLDDLQNRPSACKSLSLPDSNYKMVPQPALASYKLQNGPSTHDSLVLLHSIYKMASWLTIACVSLRFLQNGPSGKWNPTD